MKIIRSIISAIVFCLAITGCQKDLEVKVTGITLSSESLSLVVGEENSSLSATVSPFNATNTKVLWSSSDSRIASVSGTGVVTAVSPGSATIQVKSDDGGYTATCKVVVVSELVKVSGITLKNEDGTKLDSLTLVKGNSFKIIAAVEPETATDKSIRWTSSSDSVVKVSDKGELTAEKVGKAVIVATSVDGAYSATCNVDVIQPAARIVLETTDLVLNEYENYLLKATIEPQDSGTELVWESSDESLIKVFNGMVSAGKMRESGENEATITVSSKADANIKAQCNVRVSCKVAGVRFEYPDMYVKEGNIIDVPVHVYPKRAVNGNISLTFKDNGSEYAEIVDGNKVKGVNPGVATIVAESEDGGFKAEARIHVFSRVDGIVIDPNAIELDLIKDINGKQLTATISPQQASIPDIRWTSSNENVVSVSDGVVKPVSAGNATVIASTVDGGLVASCAVSVVSGLRSISFAQGDVEIYEGASMALNLNYDPADATDKDVVWSSSDTTVLRVVNGTVISLKGGSATITAVAQNNSSINASCNVNVISRISGITLNRSGITLEKGMTFKLVATVTPEGVPDKDKVLEWTCSPAEGIVSVSGDGTVTAVGSGQAIVTVYTKNREFSASCEVNVINPVSKFKLKAENGVTGVFEGETIQIVPDDIKPADADSYEFEWESSDSAVATVDDKGNVTGKKASSGSKVTIKAWVKGHENVRDSITLDVLAHVKSVDFDPVELTMLKGGYANIVVKASPEWAAVKEMESVQPENNEIATLFLDQSSGEYLVMAKNEGTTKIKAVSRDGGITGYCTVTVRNSEPQVVKVSDITLSVVSPITLKVGETRQVTATAVPDNADNKTLKWSSDNGIYASVKNGLITANKEGETDIFVESTDGSGVKKTIHVKVESAQQTVPVDGVSLNITEKTIDKGGEFELVASVSPQNADNKNVTWEIVSGDGVVGINVTGATCRVSGLDAGQASIRATTEDGGKTATCNITVKEVTVAVPVERIELDQEYVTLGIGESTVIKATVLPADASNPGVIITIPTGQLGTVEAEIIGRKSNVAEIRLTGVMEIEKARVNVKSDENTAILAICFVTVKRIPVETVELNRESIVLKEGMSTDMLKATVYPSNATDKSVTWSISDSTVAMIDSKTGKIDALKKGEAIITATAEGGHSATCSIKVNSSVVDGGATEGLIFDDLNS